MSRKFQNKLKSKTNTKKPNIKNKNHTNNNYTYIYGTHASKAALLNKNRKILNIYISKNKLEYFKIWLKENSADLILTKISILDLDEQIIKKANIPSDVNHQGIILECHKLSKYLLEDYINHIEKSKNQQALFIMLDQVTDPHNIGAILRSASAFNADGVILHRFNSPEESGAMAKSACGSMEKIPLFYVDNLVNTQKLLQKHGFWNIAMIADGDKKISNIEFSDKTLLIFGSEGKGVRRLVLENCDITANIPMSSNTESINISNAVSITLYEHFTHSS